MVRDQRTPASSLEPPPDYVSLPLTKVRVGVRLTRPVYDGRPGANQLLLAAGKQITPGALEGIKNRGIVSLLVHRNDLSQVNQSPVPVHRTQRSSVTSRSAMTPQPTSSANQTRKSWAGWKVDSDSYLHRLQPQETGPRSLDRMVLFQASYDQAVKTTSIVIERLTQERRLLADSLLQTSERQLTEMQSDIDEFLIRGTAPITEDYPSRHSLQTAMLATSMATIMGYSQDELIDLAFGCLLHDVGMLMIPHRLLSAALPIPANDRIELQKHPIISANLVQDCREVPQAARHVIYQMHERMNGTGYPRGRSGTQIHPMARIAAVADAYLAMISPRPHRPPLSPYQAIERLLLSARQGQFDPSAIRALLHTVSLFPVGSKVRLNDGQIAEVIRSNREQFAFPTIQLINPLDPEPGEVIDLSTQSGLQVAGALDSLVKNPQDETSSNALVHAAAAAL
ncbi:HD domain-containing protein [bacterium]|nr:HD domain-containing protein [bacterium]